jgi:hypothetical protein
MLFSFRVCILCLVVSELGGVSGRVCTVDIHGLSDNSTNSFRFGHHIISRMGHRTNETKLPHLVF